MIMRNPHIYKRRSKSMFKQIKRMLIGEEVIEQKPEPVVAKPDMFADIEGLDTAKTVLKQILHAQAPVNTIIHSLPGLAKTVIAKAIYNANKERSIYLDGNYITKAGLVEELADNRNNKTVLLIIDELEKADKAVLKMLLNIIEGGDVIKKTKTETIRFKQNVSIDWNM